MTRQVFPVRIGSNRQAYRRTGGRWRICSDSPSPETVRGSFTYRAYRTGSAALKGCRAPGTGTGAARWSLSRAAITGSISRAGVGHAPRRALANCGVFGGRAEPAWTKPGQVAPNRAGFGTIVQIESWLSGPALSVRGLG